MSVEQIVVGIIQRDFMNIAERVERDFKAEVGKHNRSGEAQASIGIVMQDESSIVIGSYNDHLFFLDQGNDQRVKVIKPVRKKALKFTDGSLHGSASTYKGFHIAKKVADRYR